MTAIPNARLSILLAGVLLVGLPACTKAEFFPTEPKTFPKHRSADAVEVLDVAPGRDDPKLRHIGFVIASGSNMAKALKACRVRAADGGADAITAVPVEKGWRCDAYRYKANGTLGGTAGEDASSKSEIPHDAAPPTASQLCLSLELVKELDANRSIGAAKLRELSSMFGAAALSMEGSEHPAAAGPLRQIAQQLYDFGGLVADSEVPEGKDIKSVQAAAEIAQQRLGSYCPESQ